MLCGNNASLIINTFLTTGRLKEHKSTFCVSLAACLSPVSVLASMSGEVIAVQCVREQLGELGAQGTPCQLKPGGMPWGWWPGPTKSSAHKVVRWVCSPTEIPPWGWPLAQRGHQHQQNAAQERGSSLRLSFRGSEVNVGEAQVWLIRKIKAH